MNDIKIGFFGGVDEFGENSSALCVYLGFFMFNRMPFGVT